MKRPRRLLKLATRSFEVDWRFACIGAALFTLAHVFALAHHELWRDELHTLALARDSNGLGDLLFGNRRYDGHPFLWYYVLYLATRITRGTIALVAVTLLASSTAALLWLRFARLPRLLRVLALAGHVIFYEHGVIARSYALGLVLLFAFVAVYRSERVRYGWLTSLLVLLAATSSYGFVVALSLGSFLFLRDGVLTRARVTRGRSAVAVPLAWAVSLAAFLFGLGFVYYTSRPPPDAFFVPPSLYGALEVRLDRTTLVPALQRFLVAMVPYPGPTDANWVVTSHLGQHQLTPERAAAFGALLFLACALSLKSSLRACLAFVFGVVVMALVQQLIYLGGLRHWGHALLLYLVCLALARQEARRRKPGWLALLPALAVCSVQALTLARTLRVDYRLPFSGAPEVARFVRDRNLLDLPIVAEPDYGGATVATYLDKPVFFAGSGERGQWVIFHNRRPKAAGEALVSALKLELETHPRALLLLTFDLAELPAPDLRLKHLLTTAPSILLDERFRLYEVVPVAPTLESPEG